MPLRPVDPTPELRALLPVPLESARSFESARPELVARLEQGEHPGEGWLEEIRVLSTAMRGTSPEPEPS